MDSQARADADIARAWVSDEPDALRRAYERWGSLVFGLARAAVGNHEAEDVTQQVFLRAWKSRDTFDPQRGPLGAWLVGITRRVVADTLRTQQRTPIPVDQQEQGSPEGSPAIDHDELLAIYEELERIGDPPRTVVVMMYVMGKTHSEIAETLGLPLGTVKSHATRTLARLRTALGGER